MSQIIRKLYNDRGLEPPIIPSTPENEDIMKTLANQVL